MATATREVRVCDFDDQLATSTIVFRGPDGRNHALDVCDATLRELMRKSHAPRRGRRPGSATGKRKGTVQRKGAAARKTNAKRKGTGRKKGAARKRRAKNAT
jgi:hypothetical protein